MEYAGLLLASGVLLGAGAAHGAVECPPTERGHMLERVSVFDGPPAEMADLRPDAKGRTDTWSRLGATGRPVYLVCRYKDLTATLEVRLPAGIRACVGVRRSDDTYSGVVCR